LSSDAVAAYYYTIFCSKLQRARENFFGQYYFSAILAAAARRCRFAREKYKYIKYKKSLAIFSKKRYNNYM